jgi:hypothetical protein
MTYDDRKRQSRVNLWRMSNFNAVLIIQVCESVKEGEIERVSSLARRHRAILQHIPLNEERVPNLYATCSQGMFDLVYICGHGNDLGVGTKDDDFSITFPQLSGALCGNLTPNATVLLSCCDGGTEEIATDLMTFCGNMNWVVGVPTSSPAEQLDTAFNVLLYQLAHGSEPGAAADKASAAAVVPGSSSLQDYNFEFKVFTRERADLVRPAHVTVIGQSQTNQALTGASEKYADCPALFFRLSNSRQREYLTGDGKLMDHNGCVQVF